MRRWVFAAGTVVLACLISVLRPALATEPVFWAGHSGGFEVEWGPQDLIARRVVDNSVVFSARALADKVVQQAVGPEKKSAQPVSCHFERRLRLLSLAGPYLGFEQVDYTNCEGWAHPSEETRFRSIDLRGSAASQYGGDPSSDVSLLSFFTPQQISRALRDDPLIRRSVRDELPPELPQLLIALSLEAQSPPDMCFRVPEDVLSRFVFYAEVRGRAAVRLALPGLGPCRANLTQVGLWLPLRQHDKEMLDLAMERREGFLMVDADRIGGAGRTTFSFDYEANQ